MFLCAKLNICFKFEFVSGNFVVVDIIDMTDVMNHNYANTLDLDSSRTLREGNTKR